MTRWLQVVLLLTASGCSRNAGPAGVTLPPEGTVRIQAQRIDESEERVQWRWVVTGGTRLARMAEQGSDVVVLSSTRRVGSHVWECELAVKKDSDQDREGPGGVPAQTRTMGLQTRMSLHGVYAGGSSSTVGRSPGAKEAPVNTLVMVLVVNETTVQVPARVVLATLGYERQDGRPVHRSISLDLRVGREGE